MFAHSIDVGTLMRSFNTRRVVLCMCVQAWHRVLLHKPPLHTQNADAADPPADKSPDVIPGNEDVDAGPDSVSYDHKLDVIVYSLV